MNCVNNCSDWSEFKLSDDFELIVGWRFMWCPFCGCELEEIK